MSEGTSRSAAALVLDLWDRSRDRSWSERGIALAGAVGGGDPDALARLPLGERNALLLRLRKDLFGRRLEATAACPACGEVMEFTVDVEDLLQPTEGTAGLAPLVIDGRQVRWRLPDSRDVAAAALATTPTAAEDVLVARCVLELDGEGSPEQAATEFRSALSEAMLRADPLAEVLLELECFSCGEAFAADLDVTEFVSSEIAGQAETALWQVDAIARAYGWSESEILAMSEHRRDCYLDRISKAGG